MKILHIITSLDLGGAERALQRLITTQKHDTKPIIVSLKTLGRIGVELNKAGFQVISLNMENALSFPKTIFKIIKIIKNEKPDIVQTWLYHADFIGGIAAKLAGIESILWGVHSTYSAKKGSLTYLIMKACALLSSYIPKKILFVAEISKKVHIAHGYKKAKAIIIPNGFPIEEFNKFNFKPKNVREKLQINSSDLIIGCIARYHPAKGVDIFIKSAPPIIEKHPDTKFLLVGKGCNKENEEITQLITLNNLQNNFILLGAQDNIPEILSIIDIFCLPSRTEAFPLTLGEAMSMSIPCVAMNVGDVSKLLGDTGIIASKNTIPDLTEALLKMITLPKKEKIQMGKKARKRIEDKFSLTKINEKLKCVYQEMYKPNKP